MLEGMGAEPPSGFVQRVRRGVSYRAGKALGRADRAVRRATSSARTRPTYLVIGAQKAGTTSLHHYLSQNPAVLTARVKEVQYFTKYYARGEGWYRGQFPLVTHERAVRRRIGVSPAVGEATAACLFDPRSPERVHAFDPEMKLERWLQLFDRDQLLILMSDDLDQDPAATVSRVAGFLGVPEWHATEYPRRGVQEYAAMAPETRERLAQTFAAHDRRLVELLGRELPWSGAGSSEPLSSIRNAS
jgi:hypothetical protein